MIRPAIRIAAAAALLATLAAGGAGAADDGDRSGSRAAAPEIGGPFELVDHTGRTVTDRDFRGRLMLVFFGYTFCPDICPTDLQIMADALDLLGPLADRVQPLFISLDPERDTAEVLADYVASFHSRLVGLTGTQEQVARAAELYRVAYYRVYPASAPSEPEAAREDYLLAHSAVTYLMGTDGRLLRVFDHGAGPEAMARAIRGFLGDD